MSVRCSLVLAGVFLALLPLRGQSTGLPPQERTGVAPSRGWTPPRQSSAIRIVTVPDNQIEARAGFELAFPRKGYRVAVPAAGTLTVTLEHPRRNRLKGVLHAPGAVAQAGRWRWTNGGTRAVTVLFVVSDPMEVSAGSEPYTVGFERSWVRPS